MAYQFEYFDSGIHISFDGKPIFVALKPILNLENEVISELKVENAATSAGRDIVGEFKRQAWTYSDDPNRVLFTIEFRCYESMLAASVRLFSKSNNTAGQKPITLAGVGGITLCAESLGEIDGLLAHSMKSPWWTLPHFDTQISRLPSYTQSLLWKNEQTYHHLLPICDHTFKTELGGGESGLKILVSSYDAGHCNFETLSFVLSSGSNPFALAETTAKLGMSERGTPFRLRKDRPYPESFEYLGWCSWDAFYHEVSAAGVLEKAQDFSQNQAPIRWFLIDGGWLDGIQPGHLRAFQPDSTKFPEGFAPLIRQLKQEYGIRWVGVWQAINGYTNGIHPQSPLAQEMSPWLYHTNSGKLIPSPEPEKGFRFWDAWHNGLRNEGVDFVKVDYQGALANVLWGDLPIGRAAEGAHLALELSVGKNFSNRLINCMGMASEHLWHRPVSPLVRNSDDFYPNRPQSFAPHAMQNAYNAFYQGPFYWLDFDMWWTRHPDAVQHALLRAVSGGPIYISDRLGETEPSVLWPLILSDGRILRCDQPGLPTKDCLMHNPISELVPLKIWNRCGQVGVIAAFNLNSHGEPVSGVVGPRDIPDLAAEHFVVFEHFSRQAQVLSSSDIMPLSLANNQPSLFLILPISNPITPIGLIDKYLSPATVMDWFHDGHTVHVKVREGGVFGWVAPQAPHAVSIAGHPIPCRAEAGYFSVDCSNYHHPIWIDIEQGKNKNNEAFV